jgi:hypothetical protein
LIFWIATLCYQEGNGNVTKETDDEPLVLKVVYANGNNCSVEESLVSSDKYVIIVLFVMSNSLFRPLLSVTSQKETSRKKLMPRLVA